MSRRSLLVSRLIALFVAAGMTFFASTPLALAHEEVVSSSPEENQRVDVAPTQVVMQFSGPVIAAGTAATVVDAKGKNWVDGTPQIDGSTVTIPLESGMPEAGYEVRWRVVAGDGHPLTGRTPFTIGAGTAISVTENYTAPSYSPTPMPTVQQNAVPVWLIVLLSVLGAIILAAIIVAIVLWVRKSKQNDRSRGTKK